MSQQALEPQPVSRLLPWSASPTHWALPPELALQCAAPGLGLTSAGLVSFLPTSPCPGMEGVPVLFLSQATSLRFLFVLEPLF